jgi:hypothetical protein
LGLRQAQPLTSTSARGRYPRPRDPLCGPLLPRTRPWRPTPPQQAFQHLSWACACAAEAAGQVVNRETPTGQARSTPVNADAAGFAGRRALCRQTLRRNQAYTDIRCARSASELLGGAVGCGCDGQIWLQLVSATSPPEPVNGTTVVVPKCNHGSAQPVAMDAAHSLVVDGHATAQHARQVIKHADALRMQKRAWLLHSWRGGTITAAGRTATHQRGCVRARSWLGALAAASAVAPG